MDSNHDKELQRLLCYHYTTGQERPKLASPCKWRKRKMAGRKVRSGSLGRLPIGDTADHKSALLTFRVIKQFQRKRQYHGDKDWPDKPGSFGDHHTRADSCACELSCAHDQSGYETDFHPK